ncbi:hypothetical protein [Mesorhizobium sp. DCY119]|nr:hypothetical protein [Mesorhizobium sp. DCY119]
MIMLILLIIANALFPNPVLFGLSVMWFVWWLVRMIAVAWSG